MPISEEITMADIIETNVRRFGGRQMASNDSGTIIRYQFPYEGKALRFRDEMIALGVTTQVQPLTPTAMVIDLS